MGISSNKTQAMISSLSANTFCFVEVSVRRRIRCRHTLVIHTAHLVNPTCDAHNELLWPFPPADEFVEAVEMYREVLRSSEEHKDRLKTDSLQVHGPLFMSLL